MIAERDTGVIIEGNLGGESYRAGIDDDNMEHIIGLFTDLYSDQIRAVIREYSTNARDAQIEQGVTDPIEVDTPTALAPFFKVKDRGCGLDAEDIKTIYSRYGTSTKRATNDQNGMLGLGCKSALTYCPQFTVESVKDGMRTVCSISREDDGVPVFRVVATVPADGEPNGTEVIVPVGNRGDHPLFANKAAEFFSYWPADAVLLNGEPPRAIEGLDIGDGITLVRQPTGYGQRKPHVLVMGGVAYPLDPAQAKMPVPDTYRMIAHVPIGSLTFAPSREALMYSRRNTKATLEALPTRISAAVEKAVQDKISNAPTPRAAVEALQEWKGLLGSRSVRLRYRGAELPDVLPMRALTVPRNGTKLTQHRTVSQLELPVVLDAMFVTGYNMTSFTATHKRKLLQFADDNKRQPVNFILTTDTPDRTYVKPDQIVAWADVKAIKLPKTSTAFNWRNGRPTGAYDVHIGGEFSHVQADEIDQSETVYYFRAMNRWESQRYAAEIGKHEPDATCVCLPENRYAKFMRNFPEAKSFTVGLQAAYDAWWNSLSGGVKLGLAIYDSGEQHALRRLDPKRIDDPVLRRACYIARNVDIGEAFKERRNRSVMLRHVNSAPNVEWTCPLEAYALWDNLHSPNWNEPDLYLYLNAAYAARKDG